MKTRLKSSAPATAHTVPPAFVTAPVMDRLAARFAKRAAQYDKSGNLPLQNLADLRKAGLLACAIPTAYGGDGAGLQEIVHITDRIAQADPSTALILAMHYLHTVSFALSPLWQEPLRSALFRSIEQKGALMNGLRVEPELGTPARGGLPATTVVRKNGVYCLSGAKIFSTGSYALTWALVWARTDEENPRVGWVLVPIHLPGVKIEKSWDHIGMRATGSHTVVFDNVALPEDHLAGLTDPAYMPDYAARLGVWHAVTVGALYNGIAKAARAWFTGYLHDRVPANLGRPLSTLPRFQSLVGEIDALLLTNSALVDRAVEQDREGIFDGVNADLTKYITTENAITVVEKALAAIGNPGLSRHQPLERHYRNVLCGRVHTPQGDSVLLHAGRKALG
ncbi:acyl-CoA dehydrogenase family protein [Komagataeibacter diospyri]|uniref:acyl-CoA dehydrogenase family protein n=1 Tax=Komagataeibacter diospyri TaxID=1932662 RepID=UPI0037575183